MYSTGEALSQPTFHTLEQHNMTRINLELDDAIIEDMDYWHRRFFRCWIGGDYGDAYPHGRTGCQQYQINSDFVCANVGNRQRLRMFVISEFANFMANEFDCSTSTVHKHMVAHFGPKLETLNDLLIIDAVDMFAEDLEVSA